MFCINLFILLLYIICKKNSLDLCRCKYYITRRYFRHFIPQIKKSALRFDCWFWNMMNFYNISNMGIILDTWQFYLQLPVILTTWKSCSFPKYCSWNKYWVCHSWLSCLSMQERHSDSNPINTIYFNMSLLTGYFLESNLKPFASSEVDDDLKLIMT